MLQSLKHRGPDSTGFALYGKPQGGQARAALQGGRAGRHAEGLQDPQGDQGRVAPRSTVASKELGGKIEDAEGGDRVRLPLRRRAIDGDRRQLADYHGGRRRRRDPLDGSRSRADQGSGRRQSRVAAQYGLDGLRTARTRSATRAWRPNPTSISARPTPTGPIRSRMWRSCTTASSPTTGTAVARSNVAAIASCRTAIPS